MRKAYLKCLTSIATCEKLCGSSTRHDSVLLRKQLLSEIESSNQNDGLIKTAFDTRRVDQETGYIPRRNLQAYHRSEPFVSEGMVKKISVFKKLHNVTDDLKSKYEHVPQWQDSYTRVLLGSIERALRNQIDDNDFTENQPGVGSLDYLEQLISVRYKLGLSDLDKMSDDEIAKVLLSKDDLLSIAPIIKVKQPMTTNGQIDLYSIDRLIDAKIKNNIEVNGKQEKGKTITITLNID